MSASVQPFFACYLLTSCDPKYYLHTYIGFTVNPSRRIRQHNGELSNGAKRTSVKRPWEVVLVVYGFPTKKDALSFEWVWQKPTRSKRISSSCSRLQGLNLGSKYHLMFKIGLMYEMLNTSPWNRFPLHLLWVSSSNNQIANSDQFSFNRSLNSNKSAYELLFESKINKKSSKSSLINDKPQLSIPAHIPIHRGPLTKLHEIFNFNDDDNEIDEDEQREDEQDDAESENFSLENELFDSSNQDSPFVTQQEEDDDPFDLQESFFSRLKSLGKSKSSKNDFQNQSELNNNSSSSSINNNANNGSINNNNLNMIRGGDIPSNLSNSSSLLSKPISLSNLQCKLCSLAILKVEHSISCTNQDCISSTTSDHPNFFHIVCLANYAIIEETNLSQNTESSHSNASGWEHRKADNKSQPILIPTQVTCPSCKQSQRWMDLIRHKQRCISHNKWPNIK